MHSFKFENGAEVVDVITGFKGFIVYRVDNITGCNQYGIQPKAKRDGSVEELKHFDENRLKSTGKKATPLANAGQPKEAGPALRGQIPPTAIFTHKSSGVKGMGGRKR